MIRDLLCNIPHRQIEEQAVLDDAFEVRTVFCSGVTIVVLKRAIVALTAIQSSGWHHKIG